MIYRTKSPLLIFQIFLIIGLLPLSSVLSISDHTSHVQSSQRQTNPKLLNFKECNMLKHSNRDQQDHKLLPSQNTQKASKNMNMHKVGYQRSFWIWDFEDLSYYEINATILAVGEYCYIFMENICISDLGEAVATEHSETIRNEFDSTIYPRVTDLAGHPNGTLGDIDGDPRIIILLSHELVDYYSQRNEQKLEHSNQCEMFYIYYRLFHWPYRYFQAIAHEFHHLIWFNNEMDEPQFILEALAEYAMYHCGYLAPFDNISPRTNDFLSHPEDSLLYFNIDSEEGLTRAIDYGAGYLFACYIAERYGVDILRNLITESADGPIGIENVLKTAGYNISFNELYLNWITAVTIDELGFSNNLYGFENLDARISKYDLVQELPLDNETISLRYYGFHIHKLESPPNNFTVEINKASYQTIGVSIAFHDTVGWHIHQCLHDESEIQVTDHIQGNSIDVAYVITSFMLRHTPIVIRPNYGLGPLTDIEISIIQTPTQTNTSTHQTTKSTTHIGVSKGLNGVTVLISLTILLIILQKTRD